MITAKFLGPSNKTFRVGFGDDLHMFPGQKDVEVDAGLAQHCRSLKDRKGKPIFAVKGLDDQPDPGLDIQQLCGVQLGFDHWALIANG